jgi:hypothetical protein
VIGKKVFTVFNRARYQASLTAIFTRNAGKWVETLVNKKLQGKYPGAMTAAVGRLSTILASFLRGPKGKLHMSNSADDTDGDEEDDDGDEEICSTIQLVRDKLRQIEGIYQY